MMNIKSQTTYSQKKCRVRWAIIGSVTLSITSFAIIVYGHMMGKNVAMYSSIYPSNIVGSAIADYLKDVLDIENITHINPDLSQKKGSISHVNDKITETEKEKLGSGDVLDFPKNHACSVLGKRKTTIPSAISLWSEHLTSIFEATKHKYDKNFEYHDFTALLLHYMNPERLQSSVKSLPSQQWERVGDIINIAYERWRWLQRQKKQEGNPTPDQNEEEPRKVRILLSGASVSMGVNCLTNPVKSQRRYQHACGWPSRLENFIGNILQADLIQIDKYTEGGMTTFEAVRVFESTRFANNQEHPDIIIHAHSTNDQHILNLEQARRLNITLEENILLNNDRFVRHVLSMKYPSTNKYNGQPQCIPKVPLLLYFDDTLGNEERGIVRNLSFSRVISSLSAYYGFGVMSYADAVRDLVYANSKEQWFSSPGWPKRQVHPGMGMHISSTWAIAFNFLNMITTYCMLPRAHPTMANEETNATETDILPHGYRAKNGLPKLRGNGAIKDGPFPKPLGVVQPSLNAHLTLDNIGTEWNKAVNVNHKNSLPQCNYSERWLISDPCIFAWTTGKSLPIKAEEKPLPEIINATLVMNQGWGALKIRHGRKGSKWDTWQQVDYNITNPTFIMEFTKLKKPVEMLEFLQFTSNNEATIMRIDIYVIKLGVKTARNVKPSQSVDIVGSIKDYEWYTRHKISLDIGATYNDTLKIKFQQVGGTFAFAGMRFCDTY